MTNTALYNTSLPFRRAGESNVEWQGFSASLRAKFAAGAQTMIIRIANLALALFVTASIASAQPLPEVGALQQVAIQIKAMVSDAEAGRMPSANAVANVERSLLRFDDSIESGTQNKYRATALLLGKLKYLLTLTAQVASTHVQSRANVDLESVTATHGTECANALGISTRLAVRLNLAAGGASKGAWFRFDAEQTGAFRFTTESLTADPALELRSGCGTGSRLLSFNDDALGLDASTAVTLQEKSAAFIHLTNSGAGGTVLVSVQATNATIAGTITDGSSGQPLSASVSAYDGSGAFVGGSASTDQAGNYILSLSPGTYYIRAQAYQHVSELYPAVQCGYLNYGFSLLGCPFAQAQTVTVADGENVTKVDIALATGARISGIVRDASNQPQTSASLILYDDAGAMLSNVYADSFGRYSFPNLPVGTYRLIASENGYGRQMYDHVNCAGALLTDCNLAQAGSISISGQDVSGVDFNLPALATIQGTLVGLGAQPGGLYQPQVAVMDASGFVVANGPVYPDSHYSAGPLAPGTYYVSASAVGYVSQIFNAVDCPADCSLSIGAATPVTISQAGQIGHADFSLNPLPQVHGQVRDSTSGLPIANVVVLASVQPPASFNALTSAMTGADGSYTLLNTPPGRYYLWAVSSDHVDEVYPAVTCESFPTSFNAYQPTPCDVSGAALLAIVPGQTPPAFDFSLAPSSSISGQARVRVGAGATLPARLTEIDVYNTAGTLVGVSISDVLGNYVINDLAPGTYFASTSINYPYQYLTQIWQQIDCLSSCAPTTGTPIALGQAATVTGIDFNLVERDAIVGRVTDTSNAPLPGVLVDLFDSPSLSYRYSAFTDANGYYLVVGGVGSSFFVATEATSGYTNQIYSGVSCAAGPAYFGLCPFTDATSVGLSSSATQPHTVNFVLQSHDPIFANGFE